MGPVVSIVGPAVGCVAGFLLESPVSLTAIAVSSIFLTTSLMNTFFPHRPIAYNPAYSFSNYSVPRRFVIIASEVVLFALLGFVLSYSACEMIWNYKLSLYPSSAYSDSAHISSILFRHRVDVSLIMGFIGAYVTAVANRILGEYLAEKFWQGGAPGTS
jgi:hypothetical protein